MMSIGAIRLSLFSGLLAFSLLLGGLHLSNYLFPYDVEIFDLDKELTLGAWFSIVQLFIVGVFGAALCLRELEPRRFRFWLLVLLPLLFFFFSAEEIICIHEKLGAIIDPPTPDGREAGAFRLSGSWVVVIAAPFAVACLLWTFTIRDYFRPLPGGYLRFLLGVALFFFGAGALEALSNVFENRESLGYGFEVLAEELCEMIGVTIILWALYDLLAVGGASVSIGKKPAPNETNTV